MRPLLEAGAVVTNSTSGARLGYHMGLVAAGEVCVTASTRNFKGRISHAPQCGLQPAPLLAEIVIA